LFIFQFVQIL